MNYVNLLGFKNSKYCWFWFVFHCTSLLFDTELGSAKGRDLAGLCLQII